MKGLIPLFIREVKDRHRYCEWCSDKVRKDELHIYRGWQVCTKCSRNRLFHRHMQQLCKRAWQPVRNKPWRYELERRRRETFRYKFGNHLLWTWRAYLRRRRWR